MIFNEYERAAEIDEKQKFSADIMTDGILLARFYKTNGLSREETQEKIKTILFKLDGCFTDKFKEKSLRDIMSGFDSFELMDNEPVYFYKEEMEKYGDSLKLIFEKAVCENVTLEDLLNIL